MSKYTSMSYEKKLEQGLKLCEKLYLENYPQMKNIPLSKNKMLFEKIKYYLTGTKYLKQFMDGLENEI